DRRQDKENLKNTVQTGCIYNFGKSIEMQSGLCAALIYGILHRTGRKSNRSPGKTGRKCCIYLCYDAFTTS
ncbi:MAG TPA: hypothetical protein IAA11_01075, partial [Candidatus Blautia intestinigallinarum]|nr:hypothetical protein [Candidatus Blautia intestinigallinarum]